MARLLVIDDEPRIVDFLARALVAHGFAVDRAHGGAEGLARTCAEPYDLVVLDLRMPRVDGLAVLSGTFAVRPEQRVLVLSALADVETKVRALELGACDYLVKPFATAELLARIGAQLRRAAVAPGLASPRRERIAGIELDLDRRTADAGQRPASSSCCAISWSARATSARAKSCSRRSGAAPSTPARTSSTSASAACAASSAPTSSPRSATWAMSSTLRRFRPEVMWALFAIANVEVMFMLDHWQTVPFHFIWVSLTILYGFRLWKPWPTAIVLLLVMATTGVALLHASLSHHHGFDELSEVPLMAAMFLAMVWHARRRQVAVDALARASDREREFARDASHELRTPITIARGHAELVRDSVTGFEEERDVEVVLDELDRLAAITARLLTLAAAEEERGLARRPVDVRRLVLSTLNRWSATATRDWGCDTRIAGTLHADAARLRTAIDALVDNAIAATQDGDPISINCRAEGTTLQLEVRDGGRGIAPADLDRVFERFARIVPPDGDAADGTGLGLAIVKAIAEAHGGSVSVTSEPGAGTAFVLSLPGFAAGAAEPARTRVAATA
jgi:signal transduction histidine kinase/ActR/RegA family two-component response regulator